MPRGVRRLFRGPARRHPRPVLDGEKDSAGDLPAGVPDDGRGGAGRTRPFGGEDAHTEPSNAAPMLLPDSRAAGQPAAHLLFLGDFRLQPHDLPAGPLHRRGGERAGFGKPAPQVHGDDRRAARGGLRTAANADLPLFSGTATCMFAPTSASLRPGYAPRRPSRFPSPGASTRAGRSRAFSSP